MGFNFLGAKYGQSTSWQLLFPSGKVSS